MKHAHIFQRRQLRRSSAGGDCPRRGWPADIVRGGPPSDLSCQPDSGLCDRSNVHIGIVTTVSPAATLADGDVSWDIQYMTPLLENAPPGTPAGRLVRSAP